MARLRVLVRVSPAIALAMVFTLVGPGVARPAALECGATIESDVVLMEDLVNCPEIGLFVDADDVTIDLNGHTISGLGVGRGVFVRAAGVSVRGGAVSGFEFGILVDGQNASIADMTVSRNTRSGVLLTFRGDGASVSNNSISRNGAHGIEFEGGATGSRVTGNNLTENALDGILAPQQTDATTYEDNRADNNGRYGIYINTATSKVLSNTASGNGSAGFYIFEIFAGFSQSYLIARNVADRNGGLGIEVPVNSFGESPRDGGGNAAKLNGDPRQCLNIVCGRNRGQATKSADEPMLIHPTSP